MTSPTTINCYFVKANDTVKNKQRENIIPLDHSMFSNVFYLPPSQKCQKYFCSRLALTSKVSTVQRRRLYGNITGGRIKLILLFCASPTLLHILACPEKEMHVEFPLVRRTLKGFGLPTGPGFFLPPKLHSQWLAN